ncbi:MAG: M14 family metallopeptidase [Patescibacteria group bacterium]
MQKIAISLGAFTAIVIGVLFALGVFTPEPEPIPEPEPVIVEEPEPEPFVSEQTIGQSVEGRDIGVVTFGSGTDARLLLVGGIHGGYEWNSALLAYEMIDHLTENPTEVPEGITIDIIPDLNPDGTFLATGVEGRFAATDVIDPSTRLAEGRFNANGIDLNRNFGCKWAPESTWRGNVVSAGSGPFSEPEAAAIRDYVLATNPSAVVFWHSQANNVYASECHEGPLPDTLAIMQLYADAGSYGAVPVFDAYPITGDAEGWLASIGIPAITVELETFNSIEWSRNLAGTEALIEFYETKE